MHCRILILILFITLMSGQSLFNRFVGTDPFIGSARSTAMGNTHLLNSTGSTNVRFNPANLGIMTSRLGFNFQLNRSSVFERWSIPIKDFFGEYFANADYVANEFNYYDFSGGIYWAPILGNLAFGIDYSPLTHFSYEYIEEVRGDYDTATEEDEYASKDPLIGYQNLTTDGALMLSSIGCGYNMNFTDIININIGASINQINSSGISDRTNIDTLKLYDTYGYPTYSDIANLSNYPDVDQSSDIPKSSFISLSTQLTINSHSIIGVSWEGKANSETTAHITSIDSTNGLFQYWDSSTIEDSIFYTVNGINYIKPEMKSLAFNYIADADHGISLSFEMNQISYNGHLNLNDYQQFKFGFEYLTQMGTPIRGGLVYRQAVIPAMKPISIFTFGTGKTIGNMMIDAAGTYSFQSFNYPDLFPVVGEIRSEYDLVRDSQLHLQLAMTYKF